MLAAGQPSQGTAPPIRPSPASGRGVGERSAITHLQEALALAEEIGLPGEQWQILAKLGELCRACGDEKRAQQAFTQATEIMQALADGIEDEALRAGFLAFPLLSGNGFDWS